MPDDLTTTPPPPTPQGPTRTDIALGWTVGHVAELTGIGVPLVAGALTTAWLDLVSVAVAAWWAVHQVREHRVRAEIARTTTVWALPSAPSPVDAAPLRSEGGQR